MSQSEPSPGSLATRAETLEDDLVQLLRGVYAEDTAADVAARLRAAAYAHTQAAAAMPRAPARREPDPGAAHADNAALLITYADTLRASGEPPLATLHRFLKRHVGPSFSAVHLLPFFPSSSDDGFAVVDYRMVDHHLGGWEDIERLAGDYDLMFDLVINHCSRESLWFADFVNGRDPGRHFFITLPEESDTSAVIRPRSTPLISAVHTYAGIRHVWTTFSDDQVDLDFSNPEVLLTFADILLFYVERGARLIRLDAVAFLWKRLGTSCMSLPETHLLVKALRRLVHHAAPGVRLVTETNVPHEENISYFGNGDEADLVYQFSLAPLLLYSYVFSDASYLTTWAARLKPPPAGAAYLNFIASHDGIGLRPLEGLVPDAAVARLVDLMQERGGFVAQRDAGGGESRPYEINIALYSAFAESLPAYLAAHTLLLSFQGLPAIYIHSLLATKNDLALVEQTGRTRSVNRGHWEADELDALLADPESVQRRVLDHCCRVIACRERQPALGSSAAQAVCPSPPGVFIMRRQTATQQLVIAASVIAEPQVVPVEGTGLPRGTFIDALGGGHVELGETLSLAPFQIVWLDVTQAAAEVAAEADGP